MNESAEDKIVPPKREKADYVDSAMETAISSIPVLGAPALRLFNLVITPPLERRLNEWRNAVAERIAQLEERAEGFKVEDLGKNEMFVTAVMQATQIALRNHQQEKLGALQNAVVNSAMGINIEQDLQLMFLNLVDSFTVLHLQLLKFLDDPRTFTSHDIATGTRGLIFVSGSLAHIMEKVFPEMKGREAIYDAAVQDLFNRGLVIHDKRGLRISMGATGVFSSHTTDLGKAFLEYIAS